MIIVLWIGLAIVIGMAASSRGRSGFGWFIVALCLSPLLGGVLLLLMKNVKEDAQVQQRIAQSKTCPRCAESVKTAAEVCRYCGHSFVAAASASAP